jgi:tripartite-type tricarboxylate transporter receptor subunit TctC
MGESILGVKVMLKRLQCIALAFLLGLGGAALAQDYPSRSITFVIPYGAGNASDAIARAIANGLKDRLKQSIVVENRPGANGVVGTNSAASAPRDGYTIVMVNAASQTRTFVKDPSIDFFSAFDPVIPTVTGQYAVMINAGLPARTLQEFIAHAKANPGKLNGAAGTGTNLLFFEMFKSLAGVDIVRIDYKTNPQAATAVMTNEAQVMIDNPFQYKPHIDAGKIRVITAVGRTRLPAMPAVPTAAESGLPGLDGTPISGIWIPAGSPAAAVMRLNGAVNEIFKTQEMIDLNARLGTVLLGGRPEELRQLSQNEAQFWATAAKLANFQPQ